MIVRPSVELVSVTGTSSDSSRALRIDGQRHFVARRLPLEEGTDVVGQDNRLTVHGDDGVAGVQHLVGRRRAHAGARRIRLVLVLQAQRLDDRSATGQADVVPEPLEGDVGGDLLGVAHQLEVLGPVLLPGLIAEQLAGGLDADIGVDRAHEPAEDAELRDAHGDEQHLAVGLERLGVEVQPRSDGLGLAGRDAVAVARQPGGDGDEGEEQAADHGQRDPPGRAPGASAGAGTPAAGDREAAARPPARAEERGREEAARSRRWRRAEAPRHRRGAAVRCRPSCLRSSRSPPRPPLS